jgi:ethanolamine permease
MELELAEQASACDTINRVSDIEDVDDKSEDYIVIKGDQFEHMSDNVSNLGVFELWCLGISTGIGGCFFTWPVCLTAGLGSLSIAVFVVASGYGALVLCTAELSGALPFAGGAYGIARVTLGTYAGFLIACFDLYQSVFFVTYSVLIMGLLITVVAETKLESTLYFWLGIYASYMIIHIKGGLMMWRTQKMLVLGSLGLLLIYLFYSIKDAHFRTYAPVLYQGESITDQYFIGGVEGFMEILPVTSVFFIGVESINLASHDCSNPKRDVPRAYIASFSTLVVLSFGTIFAAASHFPGSTFMPTLGLFPQLYQYMELFDISVFHAYSLALIPLYTAAFSFTYFYGSQLRAMGKSALAHPWFGLDISYFKTPAVALTTGAVVSYGVGLRYYFYSENNVEHIFSLCLLGTCCVAMSQCFSFVVFRRYYPTIHREFVSPLGVAGAVYGFLVFALIFVATAVYQPYAKYAAIAFSVYIALMTLYYLLVVRHRETFSEEEKTVLFKAYLMKCKSS